MFPKNKTRVATIVYLTKAKLLFGFNYFTNVEDSFNALDRIRFTSKQPGKPEKIGAALTKARDMLFSRSRMRTTKVLVAITGAPADDDIINPSKRLRQEGVTIFGVGFGNDSDVSQLETLSSKPVDEHVFLDDPHLSSNINGVVKNFLCKGMRLFY